MTHKQLRAQYTQEFKMEAVRQVRAGQAIAVVAKVLGIPKASLGNWVHLHGAAADRLVAKGVGPVGLTAGEVIDAARDLFNDWVASHGSL